MRTLAILFLVIVLSFVPVRAQETKEDPLMNVSFTTNSYHFIHRDRDYNEFNLGVGLGFYIRDNITVENGAFYNSFHRVTAYSGVNIDIYNKNWFGISMISGVAWSGYNSPMELPVFPFTFPIFNFKRGPAKLRVLALPPYMVGFQVAFDV